MLSLEQLLKLKRFWLVTTQGRWHVGSKVGRTIYKGAGPDDLIGVLDTREDAAFTVAVHEMIPQMIEDMIKLHEEVEELRAKVMTTE